VLIAVLAFVMPTLWTLYRFEKKRRIGRFVGFSLRREKPKVPSGFTIMEGKDLPRAPVPITKEGQEELARKIREEEFQHLMPYLFLSGLAGLVFAISGNRIFDLAPKWLDEATGTVIIIVLLVVAVILALKTRSLRHPALASEKITCEEDLFAFHGYAKDGVLGSVLALYTYVGIAILVPYQFPPFSYLAVALSVFVACLYTSRDYLIRRSCRKKSQMSFNLIYYNQRAIQISPILWISYIAVILFESLSRYLRWWPLDPLTSNLPMGGLFLSIVLYSMGDILSNSGVSGVILNEYARSLRMGSPNEEYLRYGLRKMAIALRELGLEVSPTDLRFGLAIMKSKGQSIGDIVESIARIVRTIPKGSGEHDLYSLLEVILEQADQKVFRPTKTFVEKITTGYGRDVIAAISTLITLAKILLDFLKL